MLSESNYKFNLSQQMQPKQLIELESTQKKSNPSALQSQHNLKQFGNDNQIQPQAEEHDESAYENILTPANPIIDNKKSPDQQINVKLIDLDRQNLHKRDKYLSHSLRKSKNLNASIQKPIQTMNLFNGYDPCNMLFRKFDNSDNNQLNKKKYFASMFSPIFLRQNGKFQTPIVIPPYEGMTNENQPQNQSLIEGRQLQLDFSSNFQSGNLFAVFKTGHFTYDLILQNDLNTICSTQWFYFSVNNKKNKDIIAKFNIVNLYKAASLYQKGMKPMVYSSKSSKGWKRKGQQIFYEKNCIKRQGLKKNYSSLSFSYDFTKQNDTVQFAHSIPYTYSRLMQVLKPLQNSKKCIVKSLGTTPLKKSIPIIKFESQDSRIQKKAIVIMARQHPGQVQGSFAIEQILLNLTKSSTQMQFLLWRFNIYIIPMINVDGVVLGNYRCNSMGHDLNRNWEGEQKSKHPQVVYVKTQIKKIMAKYPIQLILDLHGHSNKMNSFFYGNPFGNNPYVLPYVAAKTNSFIAFHDCTFSIERKEKAKTARSVLGNLIKDTGNVYTYEMSFFGGQKSGKIVNFYEQNFRQLGRDLLISIYKVYVQCYKQQKTLKQSLYLRQIRRQISKIQGQISRIEDSGSDSQAQSQREQIQNQRKQEIQQRIKDLVDQKQKFRENHTYELYDLRKSQQPENNSGNILSLSQRKDPSKYESTPIRRRLQRNVSLSNNSPQSSVFNYDQSLQQKILKHRQYAQKLKVYGQTLISKPNIINSRQNYQSLQISDKPIRVSSIFQDKRKEVSNINFSHFQKKNRGRNQNFSTINSPRNRWQQQDGALINDIVKVNRLEYKKIERQKNKMKQQKSPEKRNSKNQGIFKLPSILNNKF